ncbi:MAG TPA: hypothetical protein PKK33_08095, partial [Candidatus Cloacimonadota bacterium]|nr:hypothetical protein [Candidatus Cloacimonadota bacterium]
DRHLRWELADKLEQLPGRLRSAGDVLRRSAELRIENIEQAMTPGFSTADELVREMGFGAGLGLPNIKKNSDVMHLKSERGKPTKLEIIVYYY